MSIKNQKLNNELGTPEKLRITSEDSKIRRSSLNSIKSTIRSINQKSIFRKALSDKRQSEEFEKRYFLHKSIQKNKLKSDSLQFVDVDQSLPRPPMLEFEHGKGHSASPFATSIVFG